MHLVGYELPDKLPERPGIEALSIFWWTFLVDSLCRACVGFWTFLIGTQTGLWENDFSLRIGDLLASGIGADWTKKGTGLGPLGTQELHRKVFGKVESSDPGPTHG